MEVALRLCGARARDDAAALLGERERAGDERLGLVLFHPADVDPRQLKRGPRFVVLPRGSARGLERLLQILFGLRLAPGPSRHTSTAVERPEATVVIVGFDDRERLVRKLCRPAELTVQRGCDFGERRQRSTLNGPVALDRSLLGENGHLVAHDRKISELPRGARGEKSAPQGRLELHGAKQELPRREVRFPRERALACGPECLRRHPRQLFGRMSVELGVEKARLVEVIRTDLDQLLVGLLAQPLGKACVVFGAPGLRQTAVRDLADEHVLEAIRRLAADRRTLFAGDEVAQEQVVEQVLELVRVVLR